MEPQCRGPVPRWASAHRGRDMIRLVPWSRERTGITRNSGCPPWGPRPYACRRGRRCRRVDRPAAGLGAPRAEHDSPSLPSVRCSARAWGSWLVAAGGPWVRLALGPLHGGAPLCLPGRGSVGGAGLFPRPTVVDSWQCMRKLTASKRYILSNGSYNSKQQIRATSPPTPGHIG